MAREALDITITHPELIKEWHPTKNGDLKPNMVTMGSHKKVWWILSYDDPESGKHFDFEWQTTIANRTSGRDCPYLSGRAVWKGFNDLATVRPDIAAEWHPTKNGDLKPDMVTIGCNKKIWWFLPYDDPNTGKHFDFEWQAKINNRTYGDDCPYLSGQAVWKGFNDLATLRPDLVTEWHPTKNGNLKPDMVTIGIDKKVWWFLPYDDPNTGKHFDFEWQSTIAHRINGRNCPYLSGRVVWKGFNDLETVRPDIAFEWHPTKNGNLKPDMVTIGCNKKIWWFLPYDDPNTGKHFDFEWQTTIANRTSGRDCPYLSGRAVWKGFNDLETVRPNIATEWHPTKNGNLKPDMVTISSSKKVWWKCSKGHEWIASIAHRNDGCSCPICNNSKGEASVRETLNKLHIHYKEQYIFQDRRYNGVLRDDFILLDNNDNVIGAIEYNGKQHYVPIDFAGRGEKWAKSQLVLNQKRDQIKSEYLANHNIPQLVIPYTEFDNIEQLVTEFTYNIAKKGIFINVA